MGAVDAALQLQCAEVPGTYAGMVAVPKGETSRSERIRQRARQLGVAAPIGSAFEVPDDALLSLCRDFELSKARIVAALKYAPWVTKEDTKAKLEWKREQARLARELREQRRQDKLRDMAAVLERRRLAREYAEKIKVARRPKSEPGSVEYGYDSQKAKQLGAVRLGLQHVWIAKGLERYRSDFQKKHGANVGITAIVRDALKTVLTSGEDLKVGWLGDPQGTAVQLGPCRLPKQYQMLPQLLARASRKLDTTESDVIRSALAHWLTERGYDKPGRKRTAR